MAGIKHFQTNTLKTAPKPKRNTKYLVVIEIYLLQKLKATEITKQQKRNEVLLEITKTKRSLQPINNDLGRDDVNYAAASPRVLATDDWYDFKEEGNCKFYDALDSHAPNVNAEHKNEATLTKDDDDWLLEEIQEEMRKLEQLAEQLDEVTKPTIEAETEQPS